MNQKQRRQFLRTLVTFLAEGPWWLATAIEARTPAPRTLADSRYRLLRRLHGVERLVFERLRNPGGWDGRGGDLYVHQLRCFGTYDGHGGDWETTRCAIEILARRPDPPLRIVGGGDFTYKEAAYVETHAASIEWASPVALEIYGARTDAAEIVVAIWSSIAALRRDCWTAPAPRWRDV